MDGERPPQMRRKSAGNPGSAEREPSESDAGAFASLFRDAYRRCFSADLVAPLTETESHRLSVEIAESTGLEIGWKSLKNYSHYLLGTASRVENPSVPTLDTLARYVAGAPRTDEARRRTSERHYPYWFRYRDERRLAEPTQPLDRASGPQHLASESRPTPAPLFRRSAVFAALVVALAVTLALLTARRRDARAARFADDFDDVSGAALTARGWSVQAVDSAHWAQRGTMPGHLTLFTLQGDNWPQAGRAPRIENLLVRPVSSECFDVDVRFTSFVPTQNWQQAGILLLEDTTFAGRSVRMSLGYNDFSGGFAPTREVLVQAITSLGRGADRPEEVVHQRLFVVDSASEPLVRQNLGGSALRIEKRGAHLRLLSSVGSMKNAAFKEVGGADFDFRPAYVALFAMKGFVSQSRDMPVHVDAFNQSETPCAR